MKTATEIHHAAVQRALRAAELRAQGYKFRQVGKVMGVSVSRAYSLVLKGQAIKQRRNKHASGKT